MRQIAPIEEEPLQEENRLAQYYQNMLNAQAEERRSERVQETEASDTRSDEEKSDEEPSPSPYENLRDTVRLHDADEQEMAPALYSRDYILGSYREQGFPELQTADQAGDQVELDESDKELIRRLQARDAEVRQHEARHVAALGQYAGAVQYHYQIGPDGRAYAIGGTTEVRATGPSDPASTAARARLIRQAAMAGGDPSNADLSVALSATQSEQAALAR